MQPWTNSIRRIAAALVVAVLCGCGNDGETSAGSASPAVATRPSGIQSGDTAPGEMMPSLALSYEVVGTPIVGQPVSINVQVDSSQPDQGLTLQFRTNDASALTFPESQAERIELPAGMGAQGRPQQVTVVPQREGRLFLNVAVEFETAEGAMFKSMAIPVQVKRAPAATASGEENAQTTDGEASDANSQRTTDTQPK